MPKELSNGQTPAESTRGWVWLARRDSGERVQERKVISHRESQGKVGWVPCYIPSVERLILPVCRVWFLICSEGFSCQSLDVLEPNAAGSSGRGSSSSILFLAMGQGKVKKRKGEALNNFPLTFHTCSNMEVTCFKLHTASRERGTQNAYMPYRREDDACCKDRFKIESKTCQH